GQLVMAERVLSAIEHGKNLAAEGATGVGKTFAYLLAVITSKRRALVSTETKVLQDQLAHKDLPFLQEMLRSAGLPDFSFAVLKGRSNYVCLLEFSRAKRDVAENRDLFETSDAAQLWQQLCDWIEAEEATGGIAELDASGFEIPSSLADLITTDA